MVVSTIIARVADGLPLAASMDDEETDDLTQYKNQAKQIFKRIANSQERCSIDSGPYCFHYLIDSGVCYLVLCQKTYPKNLAFSYLDEIHQEFHTRYGTEVGSVARPYAFVKFDTFIQKTKKSYKDPRSKGNLSRVNEDLVDVTRIMTKNIQDVLGRGEALDRMSSVSNALSSESKKYKKDANYLNLQALMQTYGVAVLGVFLFLFVLYLRFYWFY